MWWFVPGALLALFVAGLGVAGILEESVWKNTLVVIATLLSIARRFPYVARMVYGDVRPHAFTWLIWGITQGTASAAMWYGGGGWSAVSLGIGTLMVFSIFVLSFKYGTKDITAGDTILLILAIAAILVWWQMNDPLLSVLMVSTIDAVGFLPTYRKTWNEPKTEDVFYWATGIIVLFMLIAALNEFNLLTLTYIVTLIAGNVGIIALVLLRKKQLQVQ